MLAGLCLVGCNPTAQDFEEVTYDLPRVAVEVVDGDSLLGDDGTRYRLAGINAPDPPECLAGEATRRLSELVAGGAFMETTAVPTDQFDRKLVALYVSGPADTDQGHLANRMLVAEGLALAVHPGEDHHEVGDLFASQDQARRDRVGLWDPASCGDGPLGTVQIVDVVANPPGPDEEVLDEEMVELLNTGDESVDMTGWVLRDESTQNRYTFPDGFELGPGETVTVTSGDGPFGFGLGQPIWNNSGDTALLIDDQGRIVAYLPVSD